MTPLSRYVRTWAAAAACAAMSPPTPCLLWLRPLARAAPDTMLPLGSRGTGTGTVYFRGFRPTNLAGFFRLKQESF